MGAGYNIMNVRLHGYVYMTVIPERTNATEAVVFRTYGCSRCLSSAYSRQELATHRQWRTEGATFLCPYCDAYYSIINSLNNTSVDITGHTDSGDAEHQQTQTKQQKVAATKMALTAAREMMKAKMMTVAARYPCESHRN